MVKGKESFKPRRGRGEDPFKNQPAVVGGNVPETLKEAIGTKGKPLGIVDAFYDANPYYNREFAAYSQNCQRCVVAYELRRRGYDVQAAPTYKGDELPRVVFAKGGIYSGNWRAAFQHSKITKVGVDGRQTNAAQRTIDNIESNMKTWGNGSRAVVQVFWKGGGGHVFNVENDNGRMVYVDAQTHKRVNINEYMGYAYTGDVNLVRTDNLRVSERARRFVVQA